jgi:HD-GYP domain-containing protein (c-di-GMP phosphodiesterase class II)
VDKKRAVEITETVDNYKDYDVYYQDPISERFVLYKPGGVPIEEMRLKRGMVPRHLFVSLNDQLDFVSSRHREYNERLKDILKTEPLESKQLLTRILDLALTAPVGESVPRMRDTVDIVLKEYLADESVLKRMVEVTTKDTSTSVHSVNVMLHCLAYARQMDHEYEELKSFGLMGLLHDIGKLEIPDSILKAPRRLTPEEFELIKTHPNHGYSILVQTRVEKRVRLGALQHHERCDGSGYPKRLKRNDLLPESNVLAIIDVYEALTNWRPYKDPADSLKALSIIKEEVAEGKLDKEMFHDFAKSLLGAAF